MKTFRLYVKIILDNSTAYDWITVQANTPEEAIAIALAKPGVVKAEL